LIALTELGGEAHPLLFTAVNVLYKCICFPF